MYSQNEIDEAVAAGAISADAAAALRAHIENGRALPTQDEEQFRLITGFNDIFVAIAAAILLFAVGWIGQSIGAAAGTAVDGEGPSFLAPAAVAVTSWALALFFTGKRRMALPSIILLLAFVGSVFVTVAFALVLAVGPGKRNEKGDFVVLNIKVGDRVLFGKYSGQTVKVDGDELLVMREEDLFAVVEK